jgi:hypothetical protein
VFEYVGAVVESCAEFSHARLVLDLLVRPVDDIEYEAELIN